MELLRLRSGGSERDYVHEEIAEALKRKIVVIPVRVGREGQMPPLPNSGELPEDIRDLVRYQKHDVAHERFNRDITDLVAAIHAVQGHERPFRRWSSIAAAGAVALLVAGWAGAYATGLPVWVPWGPAPQPVVAIPTPPPRPAAATPAPQAQNTSGSWRQADEEAKAKVEQWERQMALATPPNDTQKPVQSAADAVRAAHKRDVAALQSWADCNGITCTWTMLANFSPALKAINLYAPATGVKKQIAVEAVADSDVNSRNKYAFSRSFLMPVDRKSGLKISVTYYDGSTSEQRTITPSQTYNVVKLKARGQVREDTPIVYGLLQHGQFTERQKIEDWVLIIDRPPKHHRMYYTVDDGGFFEVTGQQYNPIMPQSAFANVDAITFKRPLPDKGLRMKFRDADGDELGPFEYELDWEAIARKHFESYPQADPARAAGCQYFAGRPGNDAFALAMEGTQLAMTPFGFVKLGPEQIACTGISAYGVREVRLGREITSLTAVAGSAGYTVKNFLKADPSSQRWQTTMEGPYADIYVQVVYDDGKQSEIVRTKPAKYCPAGARC